jgi:hypothetical protein
MSQNEKLEQIYESFVNGQKSQMVSQIKSYGITQFVLDFKDYCDYQALSAKVFQSVVWSFFYLK